MTMSDKPSADTLSSLRSTVEHIASLSDALLGTVGRMVESGDLAFSVPVFVDPAAYFPAGGGQERTVEEAVLLGMARETGLEVPMARLIALRNERFPPSRPRFWGVLNFDLHSAKPRLFIFDAWERSFASYLCAHGKGSEGRNDDGMADYFSNKKGSKASSLGIYRCAETYTGGKGHSLRLDGLDASNSNARTRKIVMHGADYVSEHFARKHGRIGRSEGCPALDFGFATRVIEQLKHGSFLIHWKTP